MTFEDTVAAALKNYPAGTVVLAAVSGGADSTAMLAALAAVNRKSEGPVFSLHCIHVEHGIRPEAESRGDAGFVRSLCEKWHIPCRIVSIPPGKVAARAKKWGIGIEAAARLYRRRAWFRELRRLDALSETGNEAASPAMILTAHTADDMLETVLMRILRGSGPSGLAAMTAVRGRILRPLLALNRSEVLGYLAEKNLPWREDSTNTDIKFFRNRVRHRLIPLLNDHFPHWRKAVTSLAETQGLVADFIQSEAQSRIVWQKILNTDASTFFAQPAIIREEALFQGIDRLLAGSVQSPAVKRANIRRFSEGKVTAADLGPLQMRRDSKWITISTVPRENDMESSPAPRSPFPNPHSPFPSPHETGFALLIKAPGLYTLKGITAAVHPAASGQAGGEGVFFALLPFVLRPAYRDDRIVRHDGKAVSPRTGTDRLLTAVDSLGPAAFIGSSGLLQCRNNTALSETDAARLCVVRVGNPERRENQHGVLTRGINV